MKSTLLLMTLFIGIGGFSNAEAQSSPRYHTGYSQRLPVYDYCTVNRFESYISLANSMRDFVTPHEYARLYIPLRTKASIAKITLKNFGPLSSQTRNALYEIVRFVDANQRDFDALWEVEAFYTVASDLMDVTQALSRDLQ